jgi:hypothetical protein
MNVDAIIHNYCSKVAIVDRSIQAIILLPGTNTENRFLRRTVSIFYDSAIIQNIYAIDAVFNNDINRPLYSYIPTLRSIKNSTPTQCWDLRRAPM